MLPGAKRTHPPKILRPQPGGKGITALILAGGKAKRMGGIDKGLYKLADDRPIVEHVLSRIQPQVERVLISANRNREHYLHYGDTVVPDQKHRQWGPLAGVASAMQTPLGDYLLVCPCDAPQLPLDLCERLCQGWIVGETECILAHDGKRPQPLFCLLSSTLGLKIDAYLDAGQRRVEQFMLGLNHQVVDFSDQSSAFLNINTLEQIQGIHQDN
ncbi:MAG TPA: molybdenum cofactor guanylyltransferase [Acidiferrobacteraceae bacterium]|nr:molybdenum cofactor guanylyltransferase [Acidiferrobacteraceae bacterium]